MEHPRQRHLGRAGARRSRRAASPASPAWPPTTAGTRRCGATSSAREVGDAALFLCSDLASGITGEILFVDAGYNIMAI